MTRWTEESQGLHSSGIVAAYVKVTKDQPKWEKGDFFLGRYYNRLYEADLEVAKSRKQTTRYT